MLLRYTTATIPKVIAKHSFRAMLKLELRRHITIDEHEDWVQTRSSLVAELLKSSQQAKIEQFKFEELVGPYLAC